jgi:hypothetical protein
MKTNSITTSAWTTSSFGGTTDTSPMELSALGEHLGQCKGVQGRLFALRCAVETMNGFVSARFVTTLVVVALLIGASSSMLS